MHRFLTNHFWRYLSIKSWIYIAVVFVEISFQTVSADRSPGDCGVKIAKVANTKAGLLERIQTLEEQLRINAGRDPYYSAVDLQKVVQTDEELDRAFPLLTVVRTEFRIRNGNFSEADTENILTQVEAAEGNHHARGLTLLGDFKAWAKIYTLRYLKYSLLSGASEQTPKEQAIEEPKVAPEDEPPIVGRAPPLGDSFSIENHDIQKLLGKGQPFLASWVNRPGIHYWRERIYGVVSIDEGPRAIELPPSRRLEVGGARHAIQMHFDTFGDTGWLPLQVPEGFIPETFKNETSELIVNTLGTYYIRSSQRIVQIPLIPELNLKRPLSQQEQSFYLTAPPPGTIQWPQWLSDGIQEIQKARKRGVFSGVNEAYRIALTLTEFMNRNDLSGTLYAIDPKRETCLKLLASKRFQCNASAEAVALVLRSEFQIAARVVGGYHSNAQGPQIASSGLYMPGIPHAWVEVFAQVSADEYAWLPVDGTPKKLERDLDIPSNTPNPWDRGGEGSAEDKTKSSGTAEKSEFLSLTELIEQQHGRDRSKLAEILKRLSEKQHSKVDEKQGAQTPAPAHPEAESSAETSMFNAELDRKLAGHRSIWEPEKSDNLATKLIFGSGLKWALDPTLKSRTKAKRLTAVLRIIQLTGGINIPELKGAAFPLKELIEFFDNNNATISEQLNQMALHYDKLSPNNFYKQVEHVEREIAVTVKYCPEEKNRMQEPLQKLAQLKKSFLTLAHEKSNLILAATDLMDHLPGRFSKAILRSRFKIEEELGNNDQTYALGKAVLDGQLADFRLASMLRTEWLVLPSEIPVQRLVRTSLETPLFHPGRQSRVTVQRIDELPRARNRNPGLPWQTAFVRGDLYRLTHTTRRQVFGGTQKVQPKKKVVIIFDISASMSGARAQFQTELIRSYVDRCLSEVDKDKNLVNEVWLLPFGSKQHDYIRISTVDEAMQFIASMSAVTRNQSEGTEGTEALVKVASDLLTGDSGFERLTVAMLSDGGFELDVPTVKEKFQAVQSLGTSVTLAFGAIGATNMHFIDLVDKRQIGTDNTVYQEWTDDDIKQAIAAASTPDPVLDSFWTNQKWATAYPVIARDLQNVSISGQHLARSVAAQGSGLNELSRFRMMAKEFETGLASTTAAQEDYSPSLWSIKVLRGSLKELYKVSSLQERELFMNILLSTQAWKDAWQEASSNQGLRNLAFAELKHMLDEMNE